MSEKMKAEEKSVTNWGQLLLGVLLVFTGIFSFNNPNFNVLSVVIFFGIAIIASGIQLIVSGVRSKDTSIMLIILGIINIILGILVVFNLWYSLLVTPYFFGIWTIVQSIAGLFTLGKIRKESKGAFWLSLILSVLGILVGIGLLNHPLVSYFTISYLVGLGFVFLGIKSIVDSLN